MKKNIFLLLLDFNGGTLPLNASQMFLSEYMKAISEEIETFKLKIALTLSWRETYIQKELESILSMLGKKLQRVTYIINSSFLKNALYHEVKQYRQNTNQIQSHWLVIDDTPGFDIEEAPIFLTNPRAGFSVDDINKSSTMITKIIRGVNYE